MSSLNFTFIKIVVTLHKYHPFTYIKQLIYGSERMIFVKLLYRRKFLKKLQSLQIIINRLFIVRT